MDRRPPVSHYDILQVTPQAGDDEIKRAYRRMALHHHPDRHPRNRKLAELRFKLITEAYANLKTAEKRIQYNRSVNIPPPPAHIPAKNDNAAHMASWLAPLADIFRPVKKPEQNRV